MQIHADAAHTHVRLIRRHATELSCMQMTANTFFLLATRTQPLFASDRRWLAEFPVPLTYCQQRPRRPESTGKPRHKLSSEVSRPAKMRGKHDLNPSLLGLIYLILIMGLVNHNGKPSQRSQSSFFISACKSRVLFKAKYFLQIHRIYLGISMVHIFFTNNARRDGSCRVDGRWFEL